MRGFASLGEPRILDMPNKELLRGEDCGVSEWGLAPRTGEPIIDPFNLPCEKEKIK
jgi:hypothetical protein